MKVAVCVSGKVNSSYNLIKRNNSVLKEKVPNADFYYATWEDQKEIFYRNFPNDKCFIFKEPDINYHPYWPEDTILNPHFEETKNYIVRSNNIEWSKHHSKQILIHAWLLSSISEKYDIIVRTRFDEFIWKDPLADFTPFVKDSYDNQRAIGFAVVRKKEFKNLYEANYKENPKMKWKILDQLIIHPRKLFNIEEVILLHDSKKLYPAELGWWQVLSKNCNNNHRNFCGWTNHDKNVLPEFIKEG